MVEELKDSESRDLGRIIEDKDVLIKCLRKLDEWKAATGQDISWEDLFNFYESVSMHFLKPVEEEVPEDLEEAYIGNYELNVKTEPKLTEAEQEVPEDLEEDLFNKSNELGVVYFWENMEDFQFYIGSTVDDLNSYTGSGTEFQEYYYKDPSKWEREITFKGSVDAIRMIEERELKKVNASRNIFFVNKKNGSSIRGKKAPSDHPFLKVSLKLWGKWRNFLSLDEAAFCLDVSKRILKGISLDPTKHRTNYRHITDVTINSDKKGLAFVSK